MNTYYQVTAINKATNELEVLFGSFDKNDCKAEIECERHNWKQDGYKGFKIVAVDVNDTPDPEVYDLVTGDQLWASQAPNFNFEMDKEDLIAHGLDVGYITQPDPCKDLFIVNDKYF